MGLEDQIPHIFIAVIHPHHVQTLTNYVERRREEVPALGEVEGRRYSLLCGTSEEALRAFFAWDSVFTLLETGCAQFLSS